MSSPRRETLLLPLEFSDNTVVRLPRGASSRAKQRGWMLMPMRETMQGCCSEWSMLASWRNSEKFFMASMALRCFSIVSAKTHKPLLIPQLRNQVRNSLEGAEQMLQEEGSLWAYAKQQGFKLHPRVDAQAANRHWL